MSQDRLTPVGDHLVSVVVMTHGSRAGLLGELVAAEPRLRLTIVRDDSPESSPDHALRTALRAWHSVAAGATHHLVLQDDVVPCPRFVERLGSAIDCDPARPFALFSEWGSKTAQVIRLAALSGCGWAEVADSFLSAPAVLMPAGMAREFAEFLARRMSDGEKRDAFLLHHYLRSVGWDPVVCVPNLVEHDHPLRPSLLPNGKVRGPRRTACFAGSTPLATTWPVGVRNLPPYLPYHSPHDLIASVLTDRDGDGTWRTEPAFAWFGGRGLSLDDLTCLADDSMRRVGLTGDSLPLGMDAVRESWLGAFATGWLLAESGSLGDPSRPVNQGPVQSTALRTMAAAAYRRVLSPQLLDRIQVELAPLVTEALTTGYRTSRWCGSTRTRHA